MNHQTFLISFVPHKSIIRQLNILHYYLKTYKIKYYRNDNSVIAETFSVLLRNYTVHQAAIPDFCNISCPYCILFKNK